MVDLRQDPHKIYETQNTRDPGPGDDKSQMFAVNCRWANVSSGNSFVCIDNSLGSASWDSIPSTIPGAALPNPIPSGNLPNPLPIANIPQLTFSKLPGMKAYGFAGSNGTPNHSTLTGATLGQKVLLIWEATGATLDASALFENTISVAGQIQQASNTDLSAKKYIVVLV